MNTSQAIATFTNLTRGGVAAHLDHPIGGDLNDLLHDWDLELNVSGAVVAALLVTISTFEGHGQVLQHDNPGFVRYVAQNATEGVAAVNGQPAIPGLPVVELTLAVPDQPGFPIESVWFRSFAAAVTKSKAWLIDLSACYQVRKLSAGNIGNYFNSQGGMSVNAKMIVQIVNVCSSILPIIVSDVTLRGLIADAPFVKYHTTATSTPALVKRVINNLGASSRKIFPENIVKIVDDADREYWNLTLSGNIPQRYIAIASAFLEGNGALPDDWYQGKKAVDIIMPTLYKGWKAFFKKFGTLLVDADGIDTARSVDLLFTAAANLFEESGPAPAEEATPEANE